MSGRLLSIVTWPCPVEQELLPALTAALYGDRTTVAILPDGPAGKPVATAIQPALPLERDDVATVVPTSGSTGRPKGVLLRSGALRTSARLTHERLGGPGQWLLALPPTHIAGLQVLIRSIVAETAPVALDLSGTFDPGAFAAATDALTGPRCYTALVPTQLGRLLDAGGAALDALRTYDAVLVGGAPASAQLVAAARNEGVRVVTTYGMTETSGGCVYDGVPLDGVACRVGTGDIVELAGPTLGAGYRLDPAATAAAFRNGWFRTSDRGSMDDDGRLVVLGRADDAILTGGVTVDPLAIEAALATHPAIEAAAVIGRPDREWGERVTAVVVPRRADDVPDPDQLRAWVAQRLGIVHSPREVIIASSLPILPTGKVDRSAVRKAVGRG